MRNGKFVLAVNSIKRHVRVPKRGSYYLVLNNSIQSRNHVMSVTLNLDAVGITGKPVHILYLKPLHSRGRSQISLINIDITRSIFHGAGYWHCQIDVFSVSERGVGIALADCLGLLDLQVLMRNGKLYLVLISNMRPTARIFFFDFPRAIRNVSKLIIKQVRYLLFII